MTTFPKPIYTRLAHTIKNATNTLAVHTQQIVNLQTTSAYITTTLEPGDWEDVALQNGWSNLGGYIPAQVRILQSGMTQLIGHITGGTVTGGTVIGTLTAGYYNTTAAHTFTANAVSGAGVVSHAGAVSDTSVQQANITGTIAIPTNDHVFGLSDSDTTLHLGPTSGNQIDNDVDSANINAQSLNSGATATNVNMNTPTITLDTSGNLKINNVDPNVATLSFSELIPLLD